MNVFVTWAPDPIPSPTDSYNILYKLADSLNLNSWTLANPTPLPSTATSYTITGLDDNSIYRVAVEKICDEIPTNLVQELQIQIVGCPEITYYQGPPVNNYPTLFYSVQYPGSNNVEFTELSLYDITSVDYNGIGGCGLLVSPCVDIKFPIGRGIRLDRFCPLCFASGAQYGCGYEYPIFDTSVPSNKVSSTGYYGLRPKIADPQALSSFCPVGSGTLGLPILLEYYHDYRFNALTGLAIAAAPPFTFPNPISSTLLTNTLCTSNAVGTLGVTVLPISNDSARLSGVFNYNTTSGKITQSIIDGTNQTALSGYNFSYTVEDSLGNAFPLYNMNPPTPSTVPASTSEISYYRHAPIAIPITQAEFSSGMSLLVQSLNPAPGTLINVVNLNLTGFTVLQFIQLLANQLTTLGYPSARVIDSGNNYILFGLPDPIFTGAQIIIDGPSVIGGPVTYTADACDLLNTTVDSVPFIVGEDINAPTIYGSSVGQYKVYGDTTWFYLIGGSTLTFNPNDVVEFNMFSMVNPLYQVENVTTATVYDIPGYSDLSLGTYPVFNTLNSVTSFALKCDFVEFNPGDVLNFYFTNSINPVHPFINTVTISF
jgi:hypothetical protein